MEERRLILAMVLIMMTTMVWYLTLSPGQNPISPEKQVGTSENSLDVPGPKNQNNGQTEKVNPLSSFKNQVIEKEDSLPNFDSTSLGKDIYVKTDYVNGVINTKGAVLKSWELKKFRGYLFEKRVNTLELIPQDGNSTNLGFKLDLDDIDIDFSDINFIANADSIILNNEHPVDTLLFVANRGQQTVQVKYIFYHDKYSFIYDVDTYNVENENGNIEISWFSGLNTTERSMKIDLSHHSAIVNQEGEINRFDLSKIQKKSLISIDQPARWLGLSTQYFALIVSSLNADMNVIQFSGNENDNFVRASWQIPVKTLKYNRHDFEIYLGPQDYDLLQNYRHQWERIVNFGWNWIEPLSRFMLLIFTLIHNMVPDYGLVIVIFSLLIKIIFYPLMQKQLNSMQAMQAVQPQMAALKEKYGDDPARLNKEMIKLYQEHKINPLSGCLPLLIQMPIFIALYNVLRTTIHIRDASFLWLPDLSQNPDLTIIGAILPLAMGGSMYLQQKLSSTSVMTQQQKMMLYMMPVIFVVFSFQWSTGLILYWFIQNITTIIQQLIMNKMKPVESVN